MQRGAFFCLWILFTFSLFAQNKENGSVACDSIVYKNTFRKALKKFLNFSDFDTTYISPNRYNYALMLDHFTNYEYYSVGNNDQRLRFSPNPHNKIGAYFGWRWIFLGWAVDTDWLYGKKSKKKRGTEFDLSLYSSKLGVDIFYRSTGNDYKIHKVSGFSDEIPSNYSEDFNGLKVKMKGLNLYYIFNNRRFSYPAAFSQSTNQRCNAGSFIAGFSVSTHNLNNDNWNGTLTLNYRIARVHMLTFNHVLSAFQRDNTSLLAVEEQTDAIAKQTRKNISGLSYRLMPSEKWNFSAFGKYYRQYVAGPMAEDDTGSNYVRTSRTVDSWGYGAAGTYFILPGLQAKLSYEKAYRLPTIEEMFGDEDLESGDIGIRPEKSDNINLNLSYSRSFGKHSVYVEGGVVYRNTKDYIQRNIQDLSGGKEGATYTNYGKVLTKGYNVSARYGFGRWLSVGGNFTQMNVRDNEKMQIGSTGNSVENLGYKARIPNVPYQFADFDVNFYWRDLWKKGNMLSVTYDNQYMHSFSYYSQAIGSKNKDFMVPDQFSHNLTLSYSLKNGRYNISFECRNFTNEDLYDNFSLQKAGRAFYGKVRVHFGD